AIVALVPLAPAAWAQTCIFDPTTGPGFIDDGDLSCDGNEIIVDGVTLTINGEHDFASLTLLNGAVVDHEAGFDNGMIRGMALNIAGDVVLDSGTAINLNGLGFGPDEGPGAGEVGNSAGGGGYGGQGGSSRNSATGGQAYGSVQKPVTFGSGGGSDLDAGAPGRPGGGTVRLIVGGTLTLNGNITANGL